VLERARQAGVVGLTVVGTAPADWPGVRALAAGDAGVPIFCTLGLHPHEARLGGGPVWEDLRGQLAAPGVVAVGEIGLDYHYDHAPRPVQREVLSTQLAVARELDLPIVLHEREAAPDLLDLLRAEGLPAAGGVWHSFSGDPDLARCALDLGLHLGFGGLATFRRGTEGIRDAARLCPSDRLLLETDAPYLAPVPHRGRRNEPAFLAATAAFLAELRGVGAERLAEVTTDNARRLFGIGAP
jgi:TatD DNase family protein